VTGEFGLVCWIFTRCGHDAAALPISILSFDDEFVTLSMLLAAEMDRGSRTVH
jgi:hypothetical protein